MPEQKQNLRGINKNLPPVIHLVNLKFHEFRQSNLLLFLKKGQNTPQKILARYTPAVIAIFLFPRNQGIATQRESFRYINENLNDRGITDVTHQSNRDTEP